jgi:hypothetical protein
MTTRNLLAAVLVCLFVVGPTTHPRQHTVQADLPWCHCNGKLHVYDESDQYLHSFTNYYYPEGIRTEFGCYYECGAWVVRWADATCSAYDNIAWSDPSDSFYNAGGGNKPIPFLDSPITCP